MNFRNPAQFQVGSCALVADGLKACTESTACIAVKPTMESPVWGGESPAGEGVAGSQHSSVTGLPVHAYVPT